MWGTLVGECKCPWMESGGGKTSARKKQGTDANWINGFVVLVGKRVLCVGRGGLWGGG